MPGTWADAQAALGFRATPRNTDYAINAAGWYMRRMYGVWTEPRPIEDRKRFAEASYNWGAGNVIRAQRAAGGSVHFADIDPHLPHETRTYIRRIQKWQTEFLASSQC
jgi:membrane-bound lytic murein transglycosylase MltF